MGKEGGLTMELAVHKPLGDVAERSFVVVGKRSIVRVETSVAPIQNSSFEFAVAYGPENDRFLHRSDPSTTRLRSLGVKQTSFHLRRVHEARK
jgi:hypothetical protein